MRTHRVAVMSRILVLDGRALLERAFYAAPPNAFRSTAGHSSSAVATVLGLLARVVVDEQPTHIVATLGAPASTTPVAQQEAPLAAALHALAVRTVCVQDVSSTEVAAALGKALAVPTGADPARQVMVCSPRREVLQLASSSCTVLLAAANLAGVVRYCPAEVKVRVGVEPAQVPSLLALIGDTGAGLPGIPGIGAATATRLLGEYGDLDGVLQRAASVPGRPGQALRAHAEQARATVQIATLQGDAPVVLAVDELTRAPIDGGTATAVLHDLGIPSGDIIHELTQAPPALVERPALTRRTVAPGELGAWLNAHAAPGVTTALVALDGTLGIAASDGAGATTSLDALDAADRQVLAAWVGDPACGLVMHDAKATIHALERVLPRVCASGLVGDTMLAGYLLDPAVPAPALDDVAHTYLPAATLADTSDAGDAAARARRVLDMSDALEITLEQAGAGHLYRDIETPLTTMLARMETTGVAVDVDVLAVLAGDYAGQAADAQARAHAAIGSHPVNLASPTALQEVLFGQLRMPGGRRTRTGYSTDVDAITKLRATHPHLFLDALQDHRDAAKLRGIVDSLTRAIEDDGRIHTTFQQAQTATGRLSSSAPNLQNVPVRSEQGRRIRAAFVPGPGFESLMSVDYAQIELRIMAHASGDTALIDAITAGEDLHTTVAALVHQISTTDVTPTQRTAVKAMTYGLAYGLSSHGLAAQLGTTRDEARDLAARFFTRFGAVRDYLRGTVQAARATGYTQTLLGRRRYLPDLDSTRRTAAERAALNAPIQGTAADLTKLAMLATERALTTAGLTSRVLLQVHDELLLEIAPSEHDTVTRLLHDTLTSIYPLRVPLQVSIGTGPTWRDAEH